MIYTKRPKEFWEGALREFIKDELRERKITHSQFAGMLRKAKANETQTTITNKLSRGTFRASFLVVALAVLGVERVEIGRIADLGYKLEKAGKGKARAPRKKSIKKSKSSMYRRFDEAGRETGRHEIPAAIISEVEERYIRKK